MLKILAGVLGAILLATIVWAMREASIWESGAMIMADPWGIVTMMDLYVGFVLISIVIGLIEQSNLQRLLWIAPIFVLGNIWSALWLVVRWNTIWIRFTAR